MNLPSWAEWLDSRQVSIKCKTCTCVYCESDSRQQKAGHYPKNCVSCQRTKREEARKALPLNAELVEAVKSHAMANYNADGWDVIVEAYTDAELWEVIAGSKDAKQAIRKAKAVASLHAERRSEVRATAW